MLAPNAYPVSSNVPPDSDLYEKLEKLHAFGLVTNYISGMNPLSREEFARQLKEAIENSQKLQKIPALAHEIIEELKVEFKSELAKDRNTPRVRVFDGVQTEFLYLDQSTTPHLETNATNRSLVPNRAGERLSDCFNWVSKINGWVDFPKFGAFYIEPKIRVSQKEDNFDLDMEKGYLKLGFSNFEALFGRDTMMWGYAFSGKIEMSNNFSPITMVQISNSRPAYLPWIFRYLGQYRALMLFSILEAQRDHANPALWGWAIFLKPSKYLEWGFSRVTMLGGEGTDSLSFGEYFFEAITGLRIYDSEAINPGNGTFGFYILITLPFFRNTKLYFDGYLEDVGSRNFFTKGILLTRDLAFITGVEIPRLNKSGTLSFKTEFIKTTQITYRNGTFTDGYTHNTFIMGHHIGPDAFGNYTRFGYMPNTYINFKLDFHFERHGRTALTQRSAPLTPPTFEKPEDRYAVIFTVDKRIFKRLSLKLQAGYERIENYLFQNGQNRNDSLASLGIKYKF